ncbi:uncharacterized protein LOC120090876 [Benincasa hispida]|uniref:uncharacterized protein LOC120090876 n=1 Tax=Benincasa hispida TaxID=102211 RepID=UPI0019006140|nr:uncharacterized protein LOC120090876 [Benincasa hispida]
MSVARFEVKKFDSKGDFGLWKAKIKAILDQQKARRALFDPSTLPALVKAQEKEDWELVAYDEFKKIFVAFKTLGEKLGDENEAYVLLNSLPEPYREIKNALKYRRDNISTDTIISALRTRELVTDKKDYPSGEGNVRYVPLLKRNLISLGMLDAIGCEYKGAYVATTNEITEADVWHKRLSHISAKGLEVLSKQGILPKGKTTRQSFTKAQHTTKAILDYIHLDLWGLAPIPSLSGSSEEFNKFCKETSITRHRTIRFTSQRNGVAERLNRTIMERVRCLLSDANLREKYWAEAASYTIFTLNRCPHSSLNILTLEEKWTKHPPNLENLRVFGCVGYIHQSQGKLKSRTVKCMFVGFSEGVKGFKMWNPIEKRFIVSKDVTFREKEMFMQKEKTTCEVPKSFTTARIEVEARKDSSTSHNPPNETEEEEEENSGESTEHTETKPDSSQYSLARDRQRRVIVPPARYTETNYMNLVLNATIASNDQDLLLLKRQ